MELHDAAALLSDPLQPGLPGSYPGSSSLVGSLKGRWSRINAFRVLTRTRGSSLSWSTFFPAGTGPSSPTCEPAGQTAARLLFQGDDVFMADVAGGVRVEFRVEEGHATGLTLYQGSRPLEGQRTGG